MRLIDDPVKSRNHNDKKIQTYARLINPGNCAYCGKRIDGDNYLFLCEECRKKNEERAEE